MKTFFLSFIVFIAPPALALEPDWSEGALVPAESRQNIYLLNSLEYGQLVNKGKIHAQNYPVTVTGILPPYLPIKRVLEDNSSNPIKKIVSKVLEGVVGIKSFDSILNYLGLHSYPKSSDKGIYSMPLAEISKYHDFVGMGLIEKNGALGFTFSCATCHTSNLFGKTVLGMTNRFPKANELFVRAKQTMPLLDVNFFQFYTKATPAEKALLAEVKESLKSVNLKAPIVLGLDTSLAQVSLSLNRRAKDGYATPSEYYQKNPRPDAFLDHNPADSKPAVWWNLKYKNRWLSDGSVVSGNPIFTNIIWNEIGRGTDLRKLENWLAKNDKIIRELTAMVFASEAPHITDFYPAEMIDIEQAKRGQQIFNNTCARCHGTYEKGWDQAHAPLMPLKDRLKTTKVNYHAKTPVIDVGTDSYRRIGMKSLEQLNDLTISQKNNIRIKAQPGYVPPPLVGIWARWPYFHNNSVPNLCALLTPGSKRPIAYYSGEANNTQTDYDFACGGYPLGEKTPVQWRTKDHLYDTRRKGMSNRGHDEGIFLRNGQEILSQNQKLDLIKFLQTL